MNYNNLIEKKKIAIKILKIWERKKKKYQKLADFCSNIYKYIFDMMTSFHLNYSRGYILQETYNENMECLEKIKIEYTNIYDSLLNKKVINVYAYFDEVYSLLEKVFTQVLDIQKVVGTLSIKTIVYNEFDVSTENLPNNINVKLLNFYDTIYNCFSYTIYDIDGDYILKDSVNSLVKYNIFSDKNKNDEEKLFDTKVIETINENNNDIICKAEDIDNATGLAEKISGGKIFITFYDLRKILVLKGIFSEDPLNLACVGGTLSLKHKDLKKSLELTPISSDSFKKSFINQISLRDLICYSQTELINNCIKQNNDLKRLKGKTIASLVKEFLSSDHYKQRDILSLFLMCEEDKETQYLAYLMYDMISCESYLMKPQLCHENVYVSLHWSLKKIFKCAVNNINNQQQNLDPNIDIPYEKKIMLLKCDDNVKSKAMEKLKEIQSKNGENCVKAQQYLDGLLRIPFRVFIREPILSFLQDFRLKMIGEINYIKNLKEDFEELNKIKNTCASIINQNFTSYEITSYLNNIDEILKSSFSENSKKPNLNFINNNLENMNTKTACYNFIKKIKDILSDDDFKNLDNKNQGLIFKSKIKTSKYSLEDIKVNILNFFTNEINTINENSRNNVFTNLNIPIESVKLNNTLVNIIEKQKYLKEEWGVYMQDKKNYLAQVRSSLDQAVYGHDEAKVSISRVIAQWANGEQRGYCFGFQGPPGCGKTSLAKQGLTQCLKDENGNPRPFAFIPLGGSCNGSTLEGHSYTYVGSTWGRVVDILMECKCMNPIIFIDELDKVSESVHGKEITGILTHLTDASQNEGFSDKYFSGIDIDLSKCLIIFSYNDVSKVDKILLDRIHEINFKSITLQEKLIISKNYMIPELCKAVGFRDEVVISDEIIQFIIETYTLEAGCRKLKEKLMEILRDINLRSQIGDKIEGKEITFPFVVTKEYLTNDLFIDKPKITIKKILPKPRCGLVNGLYATQSGMGGITIIECFKVPSESKMRLELTGQQGDVMKESMSVAKTVAYNILPIEIKKKIHQEWKDDGPFGFHIHCPEGATPKDGPSAGAAITSCIYSVLTGIPVRNDIGITGEIDLNGRVHAIGGLSSKVQGAKSAGCKMVLCPGENKVDVEKILRDEFSPCDENFTIKMVNDIWEVIEILLVENELKPLDYTGPQLDYHKIEDSIDNEKKELETKKIIEI